MRRHLLVTNDFPPKVGGIQSYLWQLWRRLPPERAFVYTTPYRGSAAFDAAQPFEIERSPEPVLGPYPWLLPRIRRHADAVGAELVLFDPATPLGLLAPELGRPYGVILHGAEVTIPGRLPVSAGLLRRVLRGADLVVAGGLYPLAEGERCAGRPLPAVVVPPGVDVERFRPLDGEDRAAARRHFDLEPDHVAVVSVNRLVPRKGMHLLIQAAARLAPSRPQLRVLIGGSGREAGRLQRLIDQTGAPARLVGRLSDDEVPLFYGAGDVMAMLCHDRWAGLEQEGFGIVFLEGAAAGIPQVAGRSGGAAEAVEHGVSGLVVDDPRDVDQVAGALAELVDDPELRRRLGHQARQRAETEFRYDLLARRLADALDQVPLGSSARPRADEPTAGPAARPRSDEPTAGPLARPRPEGPPAGPAGPRPVEGGQP